MKKFFCVFMVIILSFALCRCTKDQTKKVDQAGDRLSDGTETYYENTLNENGMVINSKHFKKDGTLIGETDYEYFYDTSGRISKSRETDAIKGTYTEKEYDKFKAVISVTYFTKDGKIYNKEDLDSKGNIKKTYIYKNGEMNGYIIFDRYADSNVKSTSEYAVNGKSVCYTTYTRNGKTAQIKKFDKDGIIESIKKFRYKNDVLVGADVFDGEFLIKEKWDYTSEPYKCTYYDKSQEPTVIAEFDKNGNKLSEYSANHK